MLRVEKIQKQLNSDQLDAILITSDYNRRYVSHFTGTAGACVITRDDAFFITDFRYMDQAAKQVTQMQIIEHKEGILKAVESLIKREKIQRLGFEKQHVTVELHEKLLEELSTELVPVGDLVETLRQVKEEQEIVVIEQAVAIAEKGFNHIINYIKEGMSELQVANELDFYMRSLGASGVSFETIVASGLRSAMPHGVASHKKIQHGDMITLDFGCYYKGYVSDMTRTIALGDPGDELKKIHQIVLEANIKASQAVKPGITGAELDKVARDYITEKGYGEAFGHSLGHGIGLEVHEGPMLHRHNMQPLKPGNVITNEPGIYITGLGGVRIEDDIVVTQEGGRILNKTTKELIII